MADLEDRLRRPTVAEDAVEFAVFPLAGAAGPAALEALRGRCAAVVDGWIGAYLWHGTRPALAVGDVDGVPCVAGRVEYYEGAEDEWFVVRVLRELSAAVPDVAVRVLDADGQFVLIEAAEVLPDWMDPSGMDHRVYIHGGAVHVIPPHPTTPGEVYAYINAGVDFAALTAGGDECPDIPLPTALAVFAASLPTGFPSPAVEAVVAARVAGFANFTAAAPPPRPSLSLLPYYHTVKVTLPTPLAAAFSACPQLIPTAVRALCDRTAALPASGYQKMAAFSPVAHGASSVMLRYTRLLHAMLSQSELLPPHDHFPREAWDGGAAGLGARLACGAEAAYQLHAQQRRVAQRRATPSKPPAPSPAPAAAEPVRARPAVAAAFASTHDSIEAERERTRRERAAARERAARRQAGDDGAAGTDPEWAAYLAKLTGFGYFGDELEGSQGWRSKEEQAKEFFEKSHGRKPATAAANTAPRAKSPSLAPSPAPEPAAPEWAAGDAAAPEALLFDQETGAVAAYDAAVGAAIAQWRAASGVAAGAPLPQTAEFPLEPSSGEEWLAVAPEELDTMLAAKFNPRVAEDLADDEARAARRTAAAEEFAHRTEGMEAFLTGQKSDYRGVAGQAAPSERQGPGEEAAPPAAEAPAPKAAKHTRADGEEDKARPSYGSDADSDDGPDYVPPTDAADGAWKFDVRAFEATRRRLLRIPEPPAGAGEAPPPPPPRRARPQGEDDGSSSSSSSAGGEGGMYADLSVLTEQELREVEASKEYMAALNEELKQYEHLDRTTQSAQPADDTAAQALVANFIESLEAQEGGAGPVATMMANLKKDAP